MKNKEIILKQGTYCILLFLTKNGRVRDSIEGELVKDVSVFGLKKSDVDPWVWGYIIKLNIENSGLKVYLRKSENKTQEERAVIITNVPPGLKEVHTLEKIK